jgi:hypothetical protein
MHYTVVQFRNRDAVALIGSTLHDVLCAYVDELRDYLPAEENPGGHIAGIDLDWLEASPVPDTGPDADPDAVRAWCEKLKGTTDDAYLMVARTMSAVPGGLFPGDTLVMDTVPIECWSREGYRLDTGGSRLAYASALHEQAGRELEQAALTELTNLVRSVLPSAASVRFREYTEGPGSDRIMDVRAVYDADGVWLMLPEEAAYLASAPHLVDDCPELVEESDVVSPVEWAIGVLLADLRQARPHHYCDTGTVRLIGGPA